MTRTKASIQQTEDLAVKLWSAGLTKEQVVPYLKNKSYTLDDIHYSAASVAYVVAGIERVASGLANQKLKYTKAKGLHKQ